MMVDFEDMSYETLKKAMKKKFDVELPKENKIKDIERLKKWNKWELLSNVWDSEEIKSITLVTDDFNSGCLSGYVYVVEVVDLDGDEYVEIIRHKDGKLFVLENYFDEVKR